MERAAIEAARTMGQGERKGSDHVAVEAMRREMETVDIDGTIVIGEGERDEAPMLYIGERVGTPATAPAVDIAVDPLEGTNLCATGAPGAIAVLAAAERGGLLHAPDIYMEKLVVPGPARGQCDINAPVADNLKALARALDRDVDDLVVIVLDRPAPREADRGHPQRRRADPADRRRRPLGRHLGRGVRHRRPRCDGHRRRPRGRADGRGDALPERRDPGAARHDAPLRRGPHAKMGISDLDRVYRTEDLAPGKGVIFAAAGVTEGPLLKAVRFFRDGIRTECLVMTTKPHQVRFIDTIHAEDGPDVVIRF